MRTALIAALILAAAPSTASAQASAAESRFFDGRGREAFGQRRYDDALRYFLHAYRASESPRTLYNVALCAHLSGELALAWTSFEEYLRSDDPAQERRDDAERRMAELREQLALVRIETQPEGAAIYVGGRDLGVAGRSPTTLPIRGGGTVSIEVEAERHHPIAEEVEVDAGETVERRWTLSPRVGTIAVRVEPADAELEATPLSGGEAGGEPFTIRDGTELPVGRYLVRARADGFRSRSTEVAVAEGRTASVALTLPRRPRPVGRILVQTDPPGAEVRIDGRVTGRTPLSVGALAEGPHEVEVSRDGFRPVRRQIDVRAGRGSYVNLTLVAAD